MLKENLTSGHNLEYSQLPINISERKYQTQRINNSTISKRSTEDVLHTVSYFLQRKCSRLITVKIADCSFFFHFTDAMHDCP